MGMEDEGGGFGEAKREEEGEGEAPGGGGAKVVNLDYWAVKSNATPSTGTLSGGGGRKTFSFTVSLQCIDSVVNRGRRKLQHLPDPLPHREYSLFCKKIPVGISPVDGYRRKGEEEKEGVM